MTTPDDPPVRPLPTPPSGGDSTARRPNRKERMRGDKPPAEQRIAPVDGLDLVDPDQANQTDVVSMRMRRQHARYFAGLCEALAIRYGVSKRVVYEAIVVTIRDHRNDLIGRVRQFEHPEKVIDLDAFLGE